MWPFLYFATVFTLVTPAASFPHFSHFFHFPHFLHCRAAAPAPPAANSVDRRHKFCYVNDVKTGYFAAMKKREPGSPNRAAIGSGFYI
jgi:hypothetical protein